MSDPARGSVRTSTRTTDASTPGATAAAPPEAPPVSATQSIPTGANRVVQPEEQAAPQASAPTATPSSAPSAKSPAAAPPKQPAAPATGAAREAPAARTGVASAGAVAQAAAKAASRVAGKVSAPAAGRKPAAAGRGPRRARLQLRHIDTWSAFKISLVLSIALFFVWLVAVGVLYGVLSGLGVFTTLNELFGQLSSASGGAGGGEFITPGLVFGAAAVIGGINVVLLTALGTVTTFVYKVCSDLVGGLEVTLSERD